MTKKIVALLMVLLLVLSGCDNTKTDEVTQVKEETQAKFKEFLDAEWLEYLESDAMNLHFTLKDYSDYDFEVPEQNLGDIGSSYFAEAKTLTQASLDKLKEINKNELSASEQSHYSAMQRALEDSLLSYEYPLLNNYLSPSSGITSNYLTSFIEYRFDDQEDVNNYLLLIADYDRFISDTITYTKERISAGYGLPDATINSTVTELDKFLSKTEDNQLIETFNDKIAELNLSNADELIQKNKDIIINNVIPAYKQTKDYLNSLLGSYSGNGSLSEYENGKEYYQNLVRRRTSSEYSVDELIKMSEEYLSELTENARSALNLNSNIYDEYGAFSKEMSVDEILEVLKGKQYEQFPESVDVTYEATYLDESVANEYIVAYYLIPPVDDVSHNVIKINKDATSDFIQLYTTLAHEGMPGHLYQTTYLFAQDLHPMLYQLNYIGYTEGWAMRAEMFAIDWLDFEQEGSNVFYKFDIQFGYVMQSIIDLQVNYNGWTVEDIDNYTGLGTSTSQSIYDSVVSEPGQILSYGIGLMLFETYEAEAKKALGDKFNEVEFNKVILDNGYRSFEQLKEDIDQYVAENK